jgi:hypothetical protein
MTGPAETVCEGYFFVWGLRNQKWVAWHDLIPAINAGTKKKWKIPIDR